MSWIWKGAARSTNSPVGVLMAAVFHQPELPDLCRPQIGRDLDRAFRHGANTAIFSVALAPTSLRFLAIALGLPR